MPNVMARVASGDMFEFDMPCYQKLNAKIVAFITMRSNAEEMKRQ